MAEARGIPWIATELGGGGTVSAPVLAMARLGVRRVLAQAGLIDPPPEPAGPTRIIRIGDPDDWSYATEPGVFEPLAMPGDVVRPGQPAARLHIPEAPWHPPVETAFKRGGLVICRRHPGRAERGDCLFGLGQDWLPQV